MKVAVATSLSEDLDDLWRHALRDVHHKRGGSALLATLCGRFGEEKLLAHVLGSKALWCAREGTVLKGFAVVRDDVIEVIYVRPVDRRQKVATAIVTALLASEAPPRDAYALPGDRAMKSLYESIGWKARLLTMRGA